jgi:hypothetical protein
MNLTKNQAWILKHCWYTSLDGITKTLCKIRSDALHSLVDKGMLRCISNPTRWELTQIGRMALEKYEEYRESILEDSENGG